MLSYRHAFHAGNFADVLKHIVLVEILGHLIKKDKPFDYIDTHAGAGLNHLQAAPAEKLQEYRAGIGRLNSADWPELTSYFEIIRAHNRNKTINYYPGSPLFARHFLRAQDKAWLFELHPADHEALVKLLDTDARVHIRQEDGLQGLLALLPPASHRGFAMIDPSYEIKSDYRDVIDCVTRAWKKSPNTIFAIWYPVIERQRVLQMEKGFINSGITDIQRFELTVARDSSGHGMTGAGMIVINPPWTLREKMAALLPRLTAALAVSDEANYLCEVLVAE